MVFSSFLFALTSDYATSKPKQISKFFILFFLDSYGMPQELFPKAAEGMAQILGISPDRREVFLGGR